MNCPYCRYPMYRIGAGWLCNRPRIVEGPLYMADENGPLSKRLYDGGPAVQCIELRQSERLARCGTTVS